MPVRKRIIGAQNHNDDKNHGPAPAWRDAQLAERPQRRLIGGKLLAVALGISLLAHIMSGLSISFYGPDESALLKFDKTPPVKIKIVQKAPEKKRKKTPQMDKKKILEVPQAETEAPDQASHLGNVDHKAEKETRVNNKQRRIKAASPGQRGQTTKKPTKSVAEKPQKPKKAMKPLPKGGTLTFDTLQRKPRNPYESLLPLGNRDLAGQIDAGYQDYIDDEIAEGDRIDLNTTHYRYISYFTHLRKAIELVWNYPSEASRKGMQGEVGLEFSVQKDGRANRIKVVKSSGYEVLDRAIVDAIRLASPFSPLPRTLDKEKLVITGSFRYVLNAFGSH